MSKHQKQTKTIDLVQLLADNLVGEISAMVEATAATLREVYPDSKSFEFEPHLYRTLEENCRIKAGLAECFAKSFANSESEANKQMTVKSIPTPHKAGYDVLPFLELPDDVTDEQLIAFARALPEGNIWRDADLDELRGRVLKIAAQIREQMKADAS